MNGLSRGSRVRLAVLTVLLFSGAGLVVRRAWELGVERGGALKEMAEEQYLRDIRLSPKRGTIYDRHGAELAVSVEVESVWASPRELRAAGMAPADAAARLATVLAIDVPTIERRLGQTNQQGPLHFVWVKRRVTPGQAAAVRALGLPGVHMEREARRYYPNRELAAHLLGFANVDGQGIEGLELAFEERLRGSVRAVPAIRDRRGHVVFSEQLLDDRAAQGDELHLTIDKAIQHTAERELELAVRTFEARAGSLVVMDPHTGEILAMASYPTFDPNQPGSAPVAHRRNRAVTDRFEPGSTVKPFTVAAALAAGTIRSDQMIDCENGAMEVAEYTIHDSHAFDELTPAQILAYSSNIGTAKIGRTMGREGLFRAFRRFGFGERTGLPLPGETAGILRHYRRWYEMDAATISFGQGMSVTNLQLAAAMSAVANGGVLMRPVLVRRVTDGRGVVVEETLPEQRRRVLPRDTARLVGDMLTAVTGEEGTGAEAAIDGYLVAGKTGTAQKADYIGGGYADDRWLASFVGFAPAERPRIVISVVIDEPIIAHYGGEVAAPVFRRVGEAALRHLGVPAAEGGEALARRRRRTAGEAGVVALAAPEEPPPAVVTERAPAAGETLVPDLAGLGARGALVRTLASGLVPEISGSGVVISQSPRPNEPARRGTTLRITLAPPVVHETSARAAADSPPSASALLANVSAVGPLREEAMP